MNLCFPCFDIIIDKICPEDAHCDEEMLALMTVSRWLVVARGDNLLTRRQLLELLEEGSGNVRSYKHNVTRTNRVPTPKSATHRPKDNADPHPRAHCHLISNTNGEYHALWRDIVLCPILFSMGLAIKQLLCVPMTTYEHSAFIFSGWNPWSGPLMKIYCQSKA